MKYAPTAALALASLLFGAGQQRKPPPPEVEVIEAVARRVENRIELDGAVRNIGETAIRGLVLRFEFLSSGLKVIAVRNAALPEKELVAGDEWSFSFQTREEPRAVKFRIRAVDWRDEGLQVVSPGPYVIH